MSTIHPRPAFVAGLRALADLLEAHPDIPTPRSTIVHHFVPDAQDAEMCAEIDRLAALLGSRIDSENTHYTTSLFFGPIQYRAVAILAESRARHAAHDSYRGCVTPDSPQKDR
ncbi:hypothetical protein GCM10009733_014140 [Nonomuraea maheshkhaliensis]|uniref:Uncharacterized protein n=1 Tax=Nonomuraea maheshkhaliensis TaxID=419590 RepID=A0ABN2EVI6_9ACTN